MSAHEYDLVASAYVNLLRLPLASLHRHNLHGALCTLRDELCVIENKDAEHIQTRFEAVADMVENQQPLGRDIEKVLHDNLWDLYSR